MYAEEHENVLVCGGPAGSDDDDDDEEEEERKPVMSTWDRLYGSMHPKKMWDEALWPFRRGEAEKSTISK